MSLNWPETEAGAEFDTRTERERKLGRRQKYVHASPFNPHPYAGKNRIPAEFRRPQPSKRVRGGRWFIRKIASGTADGYQWHAYNQGSLKALSSRFPSWQLAMGYAQEMAVQANGVRR